MELSEKLASLRNQQELTQLDLAEKLNVSRQAVSRWESGAAAPGIDSLKALSKLYGVSLDYLLNDDAEETPKAEETPVVTPKEQDFLVISKKRAALILCGFLAVVAIVVGICMTLFPKQEEKPKSIEEWKHEIDFEEPAGTFVLE